MTGGLVTLVAAALLAVVTVDLGGYLIAAATAQTAADAVATAVAVATGPDGAAGPPRTEARRIAALNGGRLESCTCRRAARGAVVVEVSVPVHAVVATRLGPRRVTARSSARLVPRP